ncbi:hypothetical protein [Dyadobacter sp. NIV53]|uniref:hypothetical protein n=1 Tax=Dyadobacter sp. NIV53 TaxID=2861765 RepID=UPI001C86A4F5|nr:hypothetical protein [Dyadobacter sp. NIV53]
MKNYYLLFLLILFDLFYSNFLPLAHKANCIPGSFNKITEVPVMAIYNYPPTSPEAPTPIPLLERP